MIKIKITKLFILLITAWIFTFFSCKKDNKNEEDVPTPISVETSDTEDNNLAEEESESMDDLIEHFSSSNKEVGGRYSDVSSDLIKDTVFLKENPIEYSNVDSILIERKRAVDTSIIEYKKVTFYFNPSKERARRFRKGAIEYKFIGGKTIKTQGCTLVVTLINYFIKLKDQSDWVKVEGEKSIVVNSFTSFPFKRIVTVDVKNARFYFKPDTFLTWQSNRTREIVWDGTIRTVRLWGTASGTTRKGVNYSVKLDTLERKSNCEWRFLSGKLTFKRSDKPDRILDFGSDEKGVIKAICDPWVKVSVGTNSKVVSIK